MTDLRLNALSSIYGNSELAKQNVKYDILFDYDYIIIYNTPMLIDAFRTYADRVKQEGWNFMDSKIEAARHLHDSERHQEEILQICGQNYRLVKEDQANSNLPFAEKQTRFKQMKEIVEGNWELVAQHERAKKQGDVTTELFICDGFVRKGDLPGAIKSVGRIGSLLTRGY